MPKAWDYRVRQHLGRRYNCKSGSFDWDLMMKLHEKGVRMNFRAFSSSVAFLFYQNCTCYLQCGVISKHEYVRWRERGLAFEMREGAYQIINPTLISSRVFNQVILYLVILPTSLIWYQIFWFCLDSKGTKWLWEVTGETSFPVPSLHSASKPMTRVCWRNRMGNTSRSTMDF